MDKGLDRRRLHFRGLPDRARGSLYCAHRASREQGKEVRAETVSGGSCGRRGVLRGQVGWRRGQMLLELIGRACRCP